MLTLDGVSKSFGGPGGRTVFRDVDIRLQAGDYVAIMGDSGVGKSTLLNLIAGLDRPDSGRITLDDQEIETRDDDRMTRLRRQKMGFVFQAFHVLPYLTVVQNVALPLLLLGTSAREARRQAAGMLQAVGLDHRESDSPRELSGGELQRVAIARALVHRPSLLLADEPTGNLDPENASQVLSLLRDRIKAESASGAAGLLVTHSARAAATADHVLMLTPQGLIPCEPAAAHAMPD